MGKYKVQKQGRNENTRRLLYQRKTVVNKDQKAIFYIQICCLTLCNKCRVVFQSYLSQFFCSRVLFQCFNPCLVSVFLQVHLYQWLIFQKYFTLSIYKSCPQCTAINIVAINLIILKWRCTKVHQQKCSTAFVNQCG